MKTVITYVTLDESIVDEWDDTMQRRLQAAESAPGWVAGQILASSDSPGERVIIGVWDGQEDWAAWHEDEAFRHTRSRLERLGARSGTTTWYDTLYEAKKP